MRASDSVLNIRSDILGAGEWRSPAFLLYLDIETMEHDLVFDAHLDDSSGGER